MFGSLYFERSKKDSDENTFWHDKNIFDFSFFAKIVKENNILQKSDLTDLTNL